MAAENAPSFDDFAESSSDDGHDEEEPTVKLDPGEDIVCRIRHIESEKGEYENDLYHVTRMADKEPVCLWANNTLSETAESQDLGPGDIFAMRKHEDSRTYNGNEFHPVDVRTDLDGGAD